MKGVDVAHPIVFVSQFTIKSGKLNDLKRLAQDVATRLEAEKPQTLVYLDYFDDNGTQVTFLHVFADPDAMDLHFAGAQERSRVASEFMDPTRWEIYGRPSAAALGTIRQAAASAGVPLTIRAEYVAGFIRLAGSS
jgi:quinol monooxygenase YgiN